MIKKICFGNTDLKVSKIALGGIPITRLTMGNAIKVVRDVLDMGINFIDTANIYGDSEEKIGKAIKKYSRSSIILSSKSTATDKKTFLNHLNLSLKRLDTDYIDIYHLHAISSEEKLQEVMGENGAYYGLKKAVSDGRVRYFAFSSHNPRIAKKLMLTKKFQVVQLPFNFVDTEAEKELIPLARKMNIGFIAMKPMGGGMLEDANLAFRFLSQFEGIVPDPGIEKTEEMAEIIKIAEDPRPLNTGEKEKIEKIKKELGSSWCHHCDYCQPCKQGIAISTVLSTKSNIKRQTFDDNIRIAGEAMEKAKECIECRKCVKKCPYNLDIPTLLKENISLWEVYKEKFVNNK
ncbi:MAG: aldo/keto reductase [Actinobacteria bacterium]|nr:aldo/keto reductase [Actinomycetota bacterium]